MTKGFDHHDFLSERYCKSTVLSVAHNILSESDQSEEAFLGAQGVLLLNGLI